MIPCTIRAIEELQPGPKWRAIFEETWPAYRRWFLKEGEDARPSYPTSVRMLRAHMPELVPVHERFVSLAGGGDLAARLLTLYKPPAYIAVCSQGALTRDTPVLVRNYDYTPALFEGVILSTKLGDRRVIGTSDCLWGLLDGMNDAGLVVSLTFGGRRVVGDGFGIPLVVRYLLETCETVSQARAVLSRLPYHMAHNLTLLDRGGEAVTIRLSGPGAGLPLTPGRHEPPREDRVAGTGERDEDGRTGAAHPRALGGPEADQRALHRCLPAATSAQQGLRPGDGDDLHGRVLAHRGPGRVPLARVHVAAIIRRIRRGVAHRTSGYRPHLMDAARM